MSDLVRDLLQLGTECLRVGDLEEEEDFCFLGETVQEDVALDVVQLQFTWGRHVERQMLLLRGYNLPGRTYVFEVLRQDGPIHARESGSAVPILILCTSGASAAVRIRGCSPDSKAEMQISPRAHAYVRVWSSTIYIAM